MLEVEINQIDPSPSRLRLGLVVRYGKDGPVRFAVASVDEALLDAAVVRGILDWAARALERVHLDDERRRDQGDVPLPLE